MKKRISLFIVLAFCLTVLFPANILTASEWQIVRIDNLMVRGNSQPAFTASETVEVVVDVFAPDGVDFNACYLGIYQEESINPPSTRKYLDAPEDLSSERYSSAEINDGYARLSFTLPVSGYLGSTTYFIREISITNLNQTPTTYSTEYDIGYGHLETVAFDVFNDALDITLPEIGDVQMAHESVQAGEYQTFTVFAKDNDEISGGYIQTRIVGQTGWITHDLAIDYDSSPTTDGYTIMYATFRIEEWMPPVEVELDKVEVIDVSGNYMTYMNYYSDDQTQYTGDSPMLPEQFQYVFTVINDHYVQPDHDPQVTNITIDSHSGDHIVYPGEIVDITVTVDTGNTLYCNDRLGLHFSEIRNYWTSPETMASTHFSIGSVSLDQPSENGQERVYTGRFRVPVSWQQKEEVIMNMQFSHLDGRSTLYTNIYDPVYNAPSLQVLSVFSGADNIAILAGSSFDPIAGVDVSSPADPSLSVADIDLTTNIVSGTQDQVGVYLMRYALPSNLNQESSIDNGDPNGLYRHTRWLGVTEILPQPLDESGEIPLVMTTGNIKIDADDDVVISADEMLVNEDNELTQEGIYEFTDQSSSDTDNDENINAYTDAAANNETALNIVSISHRGLFSANGIQSTPDENHSVSGALSSIAIIDRSGPAIEFNYNWATGTQREISVTVSDLSAVDYVGVIEGDEQCAMDAARSSSMTDIGNERSFWGTVGTTYTVIAYDVLGNFSTSTLTIQGNPDDGDDPGYSDDDNDYDDGDDDGDDPGYSDDDQAPGYSDNSQLLEYDILDGSIIITGIQEHVSDLEIPSQIDSYPVIGIADQALRNKGLVNLYLPDTLLFIGDHALSENSLNFISLPYGIERIGSYALANNQLTYIDVPSSVTTIGEYTFANNQLSDLSLPLNITEIGKGLFKNNQFRILDLRHFSALESIAEEAFEGNPVKIVLTGLNLDSIGDNAFKSSDFVTVYGFSNSAAERYAARYKLTFIPYPSALESDIDTAFFMLELNTTTGQYIGTLESGKLKLTAISSNAYGISLIINDYPETIWPMLPTFGSAGIFFTINQLTQLPDGSEFWLEVTYDRNALPDDVPEELLRLYRYNRTTESWDLLPDQSLDMENQMIRVKLTGFSDFAVLADLSDEQTEHVDDESDTEPTEPSPDTTEADPTDTSTETPETDSSENTTDADKNEQAAEESNPNTGSSQNDKELLLIALILLSSGMMLVELIINRKRKYLINRNNR